jgi:hypothetical protein
MAVTQLPSWTDYQGFKEVVSHTVCIYAADTR